MVARTGRVVSQPLTPRGTHYQVAAPYLASYAAEMDWREDNRRVSNGEQYALIVNAAAYLIPVSRQWKGYWRRGTI
jgi:hypothetical protein